MSYEEARDRARFLTDKMAYELNLNEQQYNDAYEINLDYLMNIRTESDLSGVYLEHRNADFRYILYDWQYALFQAATYFFRPVLWRATGWFLPVYTIYTPTLFYYDPPRVFRIYRGGHYAYRHEHRVSFYAHRRPAWHGGLRGESRGPVPGRMTTPAPETCIGRQPRVPLRTGRQTGTTRAAQPTARQRQRPGIPVRTGRKARQHHIAAHTPREHDNARGTSTGNAAATPPHRQRATRHQQTDAKQLHPPQLHTGHRKANTAPEHKAHIAPATSGDEQAKREKTIGHARTSQADIRTSTKAQLRTEMNKI